MKDQEIQKRIPHRGPMLLVDEIVSETETSIVCRKTFRADEFFFQGHFPDSPIVPGVIQCECCLQAGAVLLAGRGGDMAADAVPVATRMDAVKFKKMIRPGDTVEIEATLKEQVSSAFYMTGKLTVDGKLATRLDFCCSMSSPSPKPEAPTS
ncbi:3-hydroxyacyl-[acyl-carrier-protein] dehydratase FabZ [Rubripirellula tenax]|uniref:3-hydroxyacyl-[acyl-carrier-protein] dehydratase FabZ n=1 Tax=Rubripirellula tenax TaxID=2528015 RepID=A0A5C6EHA6_9BACT|nr:3-hydroxyacyl-ACP dehydratase FabZ family protein [Rubripirellula tenax]TWU47427.1 3-hydroxyacyl-[acyl-carrier-protein] dehydratase FabZ [Rubripirellula tenax]